MSVAGPAGQWLAGACPACDKGRLFAGPVRLANRCNLCGLDFSQFNVGDGPAAFLIFGIGGLITALAIWLELAAEPPFWVHVLLWLPLTVVAVVGALRVSKGLLLALEYRHRAREGRMSDR